MRIHNIIEHAAGKVFNIINSNLTAECLIQLPTRIIIIIVVVVSTTAVVRDPYIM